MNFNIVRSQFVYIIFICVLIVSFHSNSAKAQSHDMTTDQVLKAKQILRVAVSPYAPFIMKSNRGINGYSIDIINDICERLHKTCKIEWVPHTADIINAVVEGRADAGISGITIGLKREKKLNFSYPVYNSGLHILIRAKKSNPIERIKNSVFSFNFLSLIGGLLFVLFIAANMIWLIERKRNPDQFPQTYLAGILESVWWAGAITSGREGWGKPVKTNQGKFFTFVWMFVGYFIFVYFTANITTSLTMSEIQDSIGNVDDLYGKKVGTTVGFLTETLQDYNFQLKSYENNEDTYVALEKGEIDAVINDGPMLQFYANHEGKGKFKVVGPMFEKQYYGIALPNDSPYRETINREILKLIETGLLQQIHDKWFKPGIKKNW